MRRLRRLSRSLRRRPKEAAAEPPGILALEPGDWVDVRSVEEIARTLDARGTHKGLWFGAEMLETCGTRKKVVCRVERIMDEKTGRIRPVRDTVMLEGSVCNRYFGCARSMPLMWREVWLKRVDAG
jgi:hypothetical protein